MESSVTRVNSQGERDGQGIMIGSRALDPGRGIGAPEWPRNITNCTAIYPEPRVRQPASGAVRGRSKNMRSAQILPDLDRLLTIDEVIQGDMVMLA